MENKNYRDELVKMLKEVGQELIDRADSMVGNNLDSVADFSIYINSTTEDGRPTIVWNTSVVNKKQY